jgi:glycerol kinase
MNQSKIATYLAIDEGTTGTTSLAMDQDLKKIADASVDFEQFFPQPGWVEHDPEQIFQAVLKTIEMLSQECDLTGLQAIGITNQRETICFWNKKTGKSLRRAIVWQDRRTAELCEKLKSQGLEARFQEISGLLLDPYFSGTKIRWALDHDASVKAALQSGELAVGTIDSYLTYRLTAQNSWVTEPSNASRTLCMNLKTGEWDAELLQHLGIAREILPEIRPSMGHFGVTQDVPGLPNGVPITGILGDQQAALLGQACIEPGLAKCTYGTGAFLLLNTGAVPVASHSRLLTTVAWQTPDRALTYALEGSSFIAGAAVQWLRDGLGIIQNSGEVEALAKQVDSTEGVVFVPALTGLGAPYWDPLARGSVTGLTRGTTRAHLARAALEGIAFQISDLLEAFQKDLSSGSQSTLTRLKKLRVDGGASANQLLMQFQADLLGVELERPEYLETTSVGAVFAAAVGVGHFQGLEQVKTTWKKGQSFHPKMADSERKVRLSDWHRAIARTRSSSGLEDREPDRS